MLFKQIKSVLIGCLAIGSVGLMLAYMDNTSPAFGLGLNFVLMFWFTIFESQAKPALSSRYFKPYPFEKQGKIYRMLGVAWYGAVLTKIGWEKMRQQQTPIKKSLNHFQAYERASRVAEVGHVVIGAIVLIITGYVLVTYSAEGVRWLILFNVLLNIYPAFLQRYTRPRLQRMIEKFENTPKTQTV